MNEVVVAELSLAEVVAGLLNNKPDNWEREAARWLRTLADSPALRASMGERGRAAIKAWSSPEVVGEAMLRRLGEITSRRVV